jgi:hypothetical protein
MMVALFKSDPLGSSMDSVLSKTPGFAPVVAAAEVVFLS